MKVFVITYITIVVLAAFLNAQDTSTVSNPDLPTFHYLLTEEPEGNRIQICELNKGFCQTDCGGPANAPKNFCNSTTMGWGCGCSTKTPDFLDYQWPINREHCVGTGQACITACGDPSVPTENKPKCNQACTETYTSKCGTPAQPPAYYNVPDITTVPTYAPPNNTTSPAGGAGGAPGGSTNSTGSNNSTSESTKKNVASSLKLGNAAFALIIIVSGIPLL